MQRLRADLQAAGFTVWIDDLDLEPGTPSWQRAVEAAIHATRGIVVILSPAAKNSEWVGRELSYAAHLGRRIFPVLVSGDGISAVPLSLINHQHVDLRTGWEGVAERLIPALRRYLGKSPQPNLLLLNQETMGESASSSLLSDQSLSLQPAAPVEEARSSDKSILTAQLPSPIKKNQTVLSPFLITLLEVFEIIRNFYLVVEVNLAKLQNRIKRNTSLPAKPNWLLIGCLVLVVFASVISSLNIEKIIGNISLFWVDPTPTPLAAINPDLTNNYLSFLFDLTPASTPTPLAAMNLLVPRGWIPGPAFIRPFSETATAEADFAMMTAVAGYIAFQNRTVLPLPTTIIATSTATIALPVQVKILRDLNIRIGPGTNYDVDRIAPLGAYLYVTGRNHDCTWLYIYTTVMTLATKSIVTSTGWITSSPQFVLLQNGTCEDLKVIP
jgi:hypothetical protein